MKRREFFEKAALGSAAFVALPARSAKAALVAEAEPQGHQHGAVQGPLATATVSFGQWAANGLDRFPDLGAPGLPNGHQLIPYEVKIAAGGTVNFIVGGFHHVLVYDDGSQPGDIDVTQTIPVTNPPGPPLINDATNRIYRGLDPSTVPQDRAEVVQFPNPGTYLVICGVLPHFANDGMYGFVRVLP
jgi:plastocyanin